MQHTGSTGTSRWEVMRAALPLDTMQGHLGLCFPTALSGTHYSWMGWSNKVCLKGFCPQIQQGTFAYIHLRQNWNCAGCLLGQCAKNYTTDTSVPRCVVIYINIQRFLLIFSLFFSLLLLLFVGGVVGSGWVCVCGGGEPVALPVALISNSPEKSRPTTTRFFISLQPKIILSTSCHPITQWQQCD